MSAQLGFHLRRVRVAKSRREIFIPGFKPVMPTAKHRALVQDLLRERANRAEFFGSELFDKSAWDLILALYAAMLDDRQILVSLVGKASGIPQTTSLRYLAKLEAQGLVGRVPNRRHKSFFIVLTDKALVAMDSYLDAR